MTSKITTNRGDLWLLGDHRLLCDDSTRVENLYKILNGAFADLVFLDPPYNVNYQGRSIKKSPLLHDNLSLDEYKHFLERTFLACHVFMKRTASMYVCHAAFFQREVQNLLEFSGFKIRNQIVWIKNQFVLSWARYKYQHELMFYCHLKKQRDRWFGGRNQSTVWQFPRPLKSKTHSTIKPVPLIEKILQNSSQKNDIVLDMFAGSGSTLIACEQQQRRAYLIEIEPHYCDFIIERWQHLTGQKAIRIKNKSSYEKIILSQQAHSSI